MDIGLGPKLTVRSSCSLEVTRISWNIAGRPQNHLSQLLWMDSVADHVHIKN